MVLQTTVRDLNLYMTQTGRSNAFFEFPLLRSGKIRATQQTAMTMTSKSECLYEVKKLRKFWTKQ